jgi:hypothetical protein
MERDAGCKRGERKRFAERHRPPARDLGVHAVVPGGVAADGLPLETAIVERTLSSSIRTARRRSRSTSARLPAPPRVIGEGRVAVARREARVRAAVEETRRVEALPFLEGDDHVPRRRSEAAVVVARKR